MAIALGIPDPIAWIDSVEPAVIDRWLEYDRFEPIPSPWLQSATIAAEVYRVASWIAASNGEKLDAKRVADFMPKTADASDGRASMTTEQMAAWAASMVNLR